MVGKGSFNNRELGFSGEERASELLLKSGFTILRRNYYAGKIGEIDIVALKENILLFVEVKSRFSQSSYGGALYSISSKKIHSMKRSAEHFLANNEEYYNKKITCRFDLISFENNELQWIEDIIR